jgi:beta-lactamase class A
MTVSRRGLVLGGMAAGAVSLAGPGVAAAAQNGSQGSPGGKILELFAGLPGTVSVKIDAPATRQGRGLHVSSPNAAQQFFIGSAIKTFVLCEAFRQADSPQVLDMITARQLSLDPSVWSADSASFNPPNMIGQVTERTAMEAMIMHSDNTATDMMLKFTGPGNVRKFLASAGLTKTMIPDSTRAFFCYLFGLKNFRTASFLDLVAASSGPYVHSPLNSVQTMASSAEDLVSYYSRALRGNFFGHEETLSQFLEVLSTGDAIWLIPVPLGVSAFIKGGSIDVPGFHAVCTPGGLYFNNRWVFFCFTINWPAAAPLDPTTVKAFAAAVHQALQIVISALS